MEGGEGAKKFSQGYLRGSTQKNEEQLRFTTIFPASEPIDRVKNTEEKRTGNFLQAFVIAVPTSDKQEGGVFHLRRTNDLISTSHGHPATSTCGDRKKKEREATRLGMPDARIPDRRSRGKSRPTQYQGALPFR